MSSANEQFKVQVFGVIAKAAKREVESLRPEQHLQDDLGLDSMTIAELLFEVEDRFDLEIPNSDMRDIKTLGDVVNYVATKSS